ncbi:MAG: GNAT family N-acetyltransferase [Lachnospiraceae bacterium]|nr:GNAT family N-acetyltransferase [Lachnospiraceae bacterium]MCI8995916.1 GNAT family N-acetyltransferase [Lachnospiraceae bacterium]
MLKGLIVGTENASDLVERLEQEWRGGQKRRIAFYGLREGGEIKELPLDRLLPWWRQELEGILRQWNLLSQECLCIAELPEAVEAARKLGIPCIGYQDPQKPWREFPGLDWVLEGFEEIDGLFLEQVHTRALGLPAVIGTTKRLLIREMEEGDLDTLYELYGDPQARRFVKGLHKDREVELSRTQAYIRYMYGLHQFGMWVIQEREGGALIGRVGFGLVDYRGKTELDFGYLIGSAWRGRGYAQEACQAALSYGKERLMFSKVSAFIHPENEPSLAVIRKLGFAERGTVEAEGETVLWFEKDLQAE